MVFLGLGSNVEPRLHTLQEAIDLIRVHYETEKELIISPIYETEPWGFESDTNFFNLCLAVFTRKTPLEILQINQEIEQKLGRKSKKSEKYESRPIDIDILFFDNQIILAENLIVPHPYIEKRKFVLKPLNAIASNYFHPLLQKTIQQLLAECEDESEPILH